MRQVKWIGSLLWLVVGAMIVGAMALAVVAGLLSANYGSLWMHTMGTLRGLYVAVAHLAIFAQVAIGIALVMVGIPLVLVALFAAPVLMQVALTRLLVALAEHFAPLWNTVRAGPFPKISRRSLTAPDV